MPKTKPTIIPFPIDANKPKVNLRKLAEFWTADTKLQRIGIVKEVKFPKKKKTDQKGYDPRGAYGPTLDTITQFHDELHEASWLHEIASELEFEAMGCRGQKRVHRECNAKAIRAYADNFSHKHLIILPTTEFKLTRSGVLVRVRPDIPVIDGDAKKLMKFHFPQKYNHRLRKIFRKMCEIMDFAQNHHGFGLPPESIMHLSVHRGVIMMGKPFDYDFESEMDKVCEQYRIIWSKLKDPEKK